MIITYLNHKLHGYLQIKLTGYSPERFLNLCKNNHIEVWDLMYQEHSYIFSISLPDYRKIRRLIKKSGVHLLIMKKMGLPFWIYRNRRRKLYAAGLLSFFILLYVLSLFLWDISFEGNYRYTYDTLIDCLKEQQIEYGIPVRRISCAQIEETFRTKFPRITWVSARVSGTRLLIKIKENELIEPEKIQEGTATDLVAARAGMITRMIVKKGIPKVQIGDRVETGQILVEGMIPITNDAEELVMEHPVQADADIYAQTSYEFKEKISFSENRTADTGKFSYGFCGKILFISFEISPKEKKEKLLKETREIKQLKIFRNFYLPVYFGMIIGKEYVNYEHIYSMKEAKNKAETIHLQIMKNLMEKGVQIIENNVRILDNTGDCILIDEYKVEESIGEQKIR